MTEREQLAALVARVEQATRPDRELDVAIARHIGADLGHAAGMSDAMLAASFSPVRPYTASLDAALALVPEGWGWHVDYLPPQTPWASLVWQGCMRHDCHAATPALALVAAALRARMEGGT